MSALGVLRRAMVGRGDGAGREATGAEGTREAASASRRRREGLNERGPGRFARERAAPERGRVHLLEPKRGGERHWYADRPPALEARRDPALADGLDGGLVAPPADAADHLHVAHRAVLVHDEADEDAALDPDAPRELGVHDPLLQP